MYTALYWENITIFFFFFRCIDEFYVFWWYHLAELIDCKNNGQILKNIFERRWGKPLINLFCFIFCWGGGSLLTVSEVPIVLFSFVMMSFDLFSWRWGRGGGLIRDTHHCEFSFTGILMRRRKKSLIHYLGAFLGQKWLPGHSNIKGYTFSLHLRYARLGV